MSARPDIPRLAEEDLDLLISRSLDGDLSPEEEQQLDRLVALDPAAARRKADLSALVADVKALPEPATPFALATRVNANVSERAGRPGSLGGRVGVVPAAGFAKVALVVLGIVGASIAILRPAPKRMAEGPVDVLLYSPARPASPAPQALVAEAKPAVTREKTRRQEADELRNQAPARDAEIALKKSAAKREEALENTPAGSGSGVLAEAAPNQKADRDDGVALQAPQAPAKIAEAAASAPAMRAMAAPAAPPAPEAAPVAAASALDVGAGASGGLARVPRGWTVSVRGDAARLWSLRRAPDNPPPARGTAVYRVTLDASGRVTELSRVGTGPADPRLDAFVRGMVFESIASAAGPESRIAAKDVPASSPDFEIGLTSR